MLDLAIVIFGLLEVTSVLSNYTFVRALRILRPLRIISKVPELKVSILLAAEVFAHIFVLCRLLWRL